MADEEKGILEELIEGICSDIEIKGAVEASRDENGKVDQWKATGMAMGLGHTSDHDIATLAGFLGAEGVFDSDENSDDYMTDDGFLDLPAPALTKTSTPGISTPMTEAEYRAQKQKILSEKKFTTGVFIFLRCLCSIPFLLVVRAHPDRLLAYLLVLLFLDVLLIMSIYTASKEKEGKLLALEVQHNKSVGQKAKRDESTEKAKECAATAVIPETDELLTADNGAVAHTLSEPDTEPEDEFEDTFIGDNLVNADDMKLLSEAGYDESDLDLMDPEEVKEAMEDAGVDTDFYDFD